MKDGKPETAADCLRELARVLEMCGRSGVPWYACLRNNSGFSPLVAEGLPNFAKPSEWSFARGIVEGRPAFPGDTLYAVVDGEQFTVTALTELRDLHATWTPPCPTERKVYFILEGRAAYEGDIVYSKTSALGLTVCERTLLEFIRCRGSLTWEKPTPNQVAAWAMRDLLKNHAFTHADGIRYINAGDVENAARDLEGPSK